MEKNGTSYWIQVQVSMLSPPRVANTYGIKILDVEITANGIGAGSGQFAIAEDESSARNAKRAFLHV
ncbi:MAG: hypothetical protein V8Q76_01705 [Bacteroides intestinalis]